MNKTERDAKIKAAVEDYHAVDPELRHLIVGSDDEFAASVASTLPLDKFEVPAPPRHMTRAAENELEAKFLVTSILGEEAFADPVANCSEETKARFRSAGAGISPLQKLIDESVTKVLEAARNGHPRPTDVLRPFAKTAPAAELRAAGDRNRKTTSTIDRAFAARLVEQVETLIDVYQENVNPTLTSFLVAAAAGDEAGMRSGVREVIAAEAE